MSIWNKIQQHQSAGKYGEQLEFYILLVGIQNYSYTQQFGSFLWTVTSTKQPS